jgi:DNA polymerase III epsilon subunit-like protein
MVVVEASVRSERMRLASVGIVDIDGVSLYEVYVPPPEGYRLNRLSRKYCPITDQQFAIAERCNGTDFEHVRSRVLGLLHRSTFVVGHAINNDFKCLGINREADLSDQTIIDTQKHYKQRVDDFRVRGFRLPFQERGHEYSHEYSLQNLADCLLGDKVQQGDHSAIEDAKTTMKLYVFDQFKIEEPERLRNMECLAE